MLRKESSKSQETMKIYIIYIFLIMDMKQDK